MLANGVLIARAQPWLATGGRDLVRAMLPLPIFGIVWGLVGSNLETVAMLEIVVYAIINLGLLVTLRFADMRQSKTGRIALLASSMVSDTLLIVFLLGSLPTLNPAIFPVYAILGIKAILYRRSFPWIFLSPTIFGPAYLSALFLQNQNMSDLGLSQILTYWGLIASSILSVILLFIVNERRWRRSQRLAGQLEHEQAESQSRIVELESINNDLRVRIRSQQALEESLRAITNSLSLEDVLNQILDSTMQMFSATRITAAALMLDNGSKFIQYMPTQGSELNDGWEDVLAQHIMRQQSALLAENTAYEREWADLHDYGVVSALGVQLIDIDNTVRGALTVVSTHRQAFTAAEARHLNSFSIQASIAIHNAELHSQLAHQQAMLEAVLRDIGDGLVVFNELGAMVLANPVAYQALAHSDLINDTLQEQLSQCAYEVRSNYQGILNRELRIGDHEDGSERAYQAFASLVRVTDDDQSYVAIVLHDITERKAEERVRTEFISMVSHELRNPLNTLNGFLKVILQGRTGELSELQREFLELANGQADQLKGRITELLEFNRLEAGRLRLRPEISDLADLIRATSARLQLQAEQSDLTLRCDIPDDLPAVCMDAERVGQVVTNLVENAIKATPAGGTIAIDAEVCDTEFQIHVTDTGIGIPAEEIPRIFGRFYRLDHKASRQGAHLGLGLSICKQIVENHNGRIWVESEEGSGSRFTFTLPLVEHLHTVEA